MVNLLQAWPERRRPGPRGNAGWSRRSVWYSDCGVGCPGGTCGDRRLLLRGALALDADPPAASPSPGCLTGRVSGRRGWFLVCEPAGQFVKVLRLGRFSGHRPERLDRQAELLQVGTTAGASLAVGHKTDSVPFRCTPSSCAVTSSANSLHVICSGGGVIAVYSPGTRRGPLGRGTARDAATPADSRR